MEKTQSELGKAIRIGLAKKGLKQKDLAILLGIKPQSISAWISGKTMPSSKYLLELTEYLDIGEDVFPRQDKKNKIALENNIGILTNLISQLSKNV